MKNEELIREQLNRIELKESISIFFFMILCIILMVSIIGSITHLMSNSLEIGLGFLVCIIMSLIGGIFGVKSFKEILNEKKKLMRTYYKQ